MPTPDRTSLDAIVRAGRDILEADGMAGLTMQAVAARVGVRAPSLYKRVRNRDELIGLITEAVMRDLGDRLAPIAAELADVRETRSPQAAGADRALAAIARATREFAHAGPAGFALLFGPRHDPERPTAAITTATVEPVLTVVAAFAGEENALNAARVFTAWAYGFLSMERAGAFNLGGDVDEAYEFGIAALGRALRG